MSPSRAARSPRRRLGLAVLVGYTGVLVLAAWRHEIRPEALDPLAAWSRSLLSLVGIPPGVAVFTSEVDAVQDAKIRTQCLAVWGTEASGVARALYPPPGRPCPRPAPRLWVRGEEIALYRSVTALRSAAASRRAGAPPPSRHDFALLLAESIAAHFRGRARALAIERFALRWEETRTSYARGDTRARVVALLRWRDDPGWGVRLAWRPDPETLARDWPDPAMR